MGDGRLREVVARGGSTVFSSCKNSFHSPYHSLVKGNKLEPR